LDARLGHCEFWIFSATTRDAAIGRDRVHIPEDSVRVGLSVKRTSRYCRRPRRLWFLLSQSVIIIRAFVRMRELVAVNKDIAARVDKLEHGHKRTASVIEVLVQDIDRLARDVRQIKALPAPKKKKIGFNA
jgi:hypothetical protein